MDSDRVGYLGVARKDENGEWKIVFPAPIGYTCSGNSLGVLLGRTSRALEGYIEGLQRTGVEVPLPVPLKDMEEGPCQDGSGIRVGVEVFDAGFLFDNFDVGPLTGNLARIKRSD